jgi:16S rRNA (cytosine967-C5)-methyltransferase
MDAALQIDPAASAQERGLLRSLSFDSVRWYLRLDAMLSRLLSRPGQRLEPQVRALAIVGLCQLVYTHIPEHAAVAETVNAARLLGHPRAAGLINALLRRYLRERTALSAAVDEDVSTRFAHPRWLVEKLGEDWGSMCGRILDANNQRPPFWVRVNRRRISGVQYRAMLEENDFEIVGSMFEDEALCLGRAVDVAELPGFAEGLVSIQDAAAQLAARLLKVEPGDRALDACAAPGGKTGHVLELQPELAELVAVDVSDERLIRVKQNLQRLGLDAKVIGADAAEPSAWWDGKPFQRILLDVPCSATGVIRRHPDIKLLRRAADIPALADKQMHLLRQTWPLLAPGGRLVYASCSALRAETTEVVGAFTASVPQAKDVTPERLAVLDLEVQQGPGYRIAAGTAGMDGFYYACLEKERRR